MVLRAKVGEMCALRRAALDWSDIEGVHSMRVASRRLRSALRDFAPYLPKGISPKSLRDVARALGAVRDEDVAILVMEKLAAKASDDVRPGIEQLIEERRARREKARAALKKPLGKDALKELQDRFNAQLERATGERGKKNVRAGRSVAEKMRFHDVGREIILARFEELREMSPSLYYPFVAEPLHRMRIAAKRLRYSIELHTQCWGEHLSPYAREVAGLQEFLGELHDCDVWIADLGARLGRRSLTGERAHERRAAIWLLDHFASARTRHFRSALILWDEWETTDFPTRLTAALDGIRSTLESQPPAARAAQAG